MLPQAGYLRDVLVSCPRASTRAAFERLATDAVAHADTEGDQAGALSRVLLELLDETSHGAARGASPGGLAHVARVVSAAAAAPGDTQRAVLIAGQAVPRLLNCLNARHAYEINASPRSNAQSSPATVPVGGAAAAAAAAAVAQAQALQNVGGFEAVVSAVERLLAGPGFSVEVALGGAEGADSVTDRKFLLAALQACPHEAAGLLTHLVWRGSRAGVGAGVTEASAVEDGRGDGGISGVDRFPTAEEDNGARQIGERALSALLDIVVDARRALPGTSSAAAVAAAAPGSSQSSAVTNAALEFSSAMGVLSRVLHLRDGEVQDRLEVALGRLAATTRGGEEEWRSGGGGGGCGGGTYQTGRLLASLFVHIPEARPVLSRSPLFQGPRRRAEPYA